MTRTRIIIGRASPVDYYVISPDRKGLLTAADSFIHAVRMGCDYAKCVEDDPDDEHHQYTISDLVEYGCRRFWHKTVTPRYYLPHETNRGYWRALPDWWPLRDRREYLEISRPREGPARRGGRSP
ncbi:MAG: hypothetical protein MPL62_14540 [Alphaproteobacteria bacterium]|nr:hypothetical protein [Alphaproteobacteria bacterium]